ncbi:MAG TPA: sulfite exporter TauE/SafE family protein [Longimicrobiaceae bacterium]
MRARRGETRRSLPGLDSVGNGRIVPYGAAARPRRSRGHARTLPFTIPQREGEMTWLLLAIGVGAGVLSGLFGIGGGVVIVPALILIAGMKPIMATGTSLGALLLPVGILGVWEYHRNGNVDLRASLLLALGLAAGAWFGARIAQGLEPVMLKRLFAAFLVVVAARMWWTA